MCTGNIDDLLPSLHSRTGETRDKKSPIQEVVVSDDDDDADSTSGKSTTEQFNSSIDIFNLSGRRQYTEQKNDRCSTDSF